MPRVRQKIKIVKIVDYLRVIVMLEDNTLEYDIEGYIIGIVGL